MSTPAHLWLEDESGTPIIGSCMMPTRLGSIELKSFSHGITIPVDPSWGKTDRYANTSSCVDSEGIRSDNTAFVSCRV